MTDLGVQNLEQTFFDEIELMVQQSNNSYLDCVVHWCAQRNLEIEYIAPLITKNLAMKAKIQGEAEDLHFLKRIARLPI